MELEFTSSQNGREIDSRFIDAPYQFVYVDLIEQYNYIASIPTKPDWMAAVNTLNNRFKIGKAIIHPRCEFLILSARSGMFNKKKTDLDRSVALGHCDGIMAMTYALRMRVTRDPAPYSVPTDMIQAQNQVTPSLVQSQGQIIEPKRFGRFK